MENRKDENMVYIKDLIFAALYHWKVVVVAAILLALVLGAYKAISTLGPQTQIPDVQAQTAAYEAEKTAMEQRVESLQYTVDNRRAYLDDSLLMRLDPYNHYEARIAAFTVLSAKNAELTDVYMMQAVMNAYRSALLEQGTQEKIGQILQIPGNYVAELISFTQQKDALADMLTVTVKCDTADNATLVADAVEARLYAMQEAINTAVAQHRIQILEKTTVAQVDIGLADIQRTEITKMTEMMSALTDAKTKLSALAAPTISSPSRAAALKKAVVFAVIGAVAGAFLAICVLWVVHIADSKVYSARTLRNRTGIKLLGCVAHTQWKDPVTRWLRKLEGRSVSSDYRLTAMDIYCRLGDAAAVLIAGSATQEDRSKIKKALEQEIPNVQIVDQGNLNESPEALQALSQCGAVVLVEKCGVSHYRDILRQMELIEDYNKRLIGCVLLDG